MEWRIEKVVIFFTLRITLRLSDCSGRQLQPAILGGTEPWLQGLSQPRGRNRPDKSNYECSDYCHPDEARLDTAQLPVAFQTNRHLIMQGVGLSLYLFVDKWKNLVLNWSSLS